MSQNNHPSLHLGLDVAKLTLQLDLAGQPLALANDAKGHAQLLKRLRGQPGAHIVCEATGGYEQPVVRVLHAAHVPVSVVEAGRVRATGDRSHRNPGAGVESLHVAIDDHSRFAFACLLPDEKIPSALDALRQALAFYKDHGISIQRLLTDRGSSYRSKLFAATCRQLGIHHHFTRPYRPQTNAKAERFIQTLTREWAYARPYDSSDHRATFLPLYLHDYNFHRPHSALLSLPPSSRLPPSADNVSSRNS